MLESNRCGSQVVRHNLRKGLIVGSIPAHISMNAQEYISSQLNALKLPVTQHAEPKNATEMTEAIFALLMSKKFRKFSIPLENQVIIRTAIEKSVAKDEPLKISFPFGGYKLWRFEETPEPDWAELFSVMHFIKWLKPICALYPKGVIFTFWFDEVVISKLNNIPESDLIAYRTVFENLFSFLKPYTPQNMQFETFLERSRYKDRETFEAELTVQIEKLRATRALDPKPLSDSARHSIEMNVKPTTEQLSDPEWQEKVDLVHYAYYNLQESHMRVRPP